MEMACATCGWFSVIGATVFAVIGTMVGRRNASVIEHKLEIEITDSEYEEKLNKVQFDMIVMTFVMIAAAAGCFVMQIMEGKKAIEKEQKDKETAVENYAAIFKDELNKPLYKEINGVRYWPSEVSQ